MASFATWASFAGHPSRSATAGHALTFNPDHPTGAGQSPQRRTHENIILMTALLTLNACANDDLAPEFDLFFDLLLERLG